MSIDFGLPKPGGGAMTPPFLEAWSLLGVGLPNPGGGCETPPFFWPNAGTVVVLVVVVEYDALLV